MVHEQLNPDRLLRPALSSDIPGIMACMDAARGIMRSNRNPFQWPEGYPSESMVERDIESAGGFVIEDTGRIVAYFAFLPGPEPTYSKIYDGQWLDDTLPYHVIHRIASYPDVHGIFKSILNFCSLRERNLRIDTHADNSIMQHNILRSGFTYCGIIHLASGDERLAYQRIEKSVDRRAIR